MLGECARARPDQPRRRLLRDARPSTRPAIAEAVAGVAAARRPARARTTRLAGLEPLAIPMPGGVFVNVGERTNVTGSRKFARLIHRGRG